MSYVLYSFFKGVWVGKPFSIYLRFLIDSIYVYIFFFFEKKRKEKNIYMQIYTYTFFNEKFNKFFFFSSHPHPFVTLNYSPPPPKKKNPFFFFEKRYSKKDIHTQGYLGNIYIFFFVPLFIEKQIVLIIVFRIY